MDNFELRTESTDVLESRSFDFVLVGGGLASATAAETLRAEGATGSIVIVGAETRLPYHRPPLSKHLLRSEQAREPQPVLQAETYARLHIELLLNTRATKVNSHSRLLYLDHGAPLHYKRLLIGTGARPIHLNVQGADLPGLHYLRDAGDAIAIHAAAVKGRHVVVIGASFIGMEVSATLRQKGLQVTMLAPRHGRFEILKGPGLVRFFASLYERHDVQLVIGEAKAFQGKNHVTGVVLSDDRVLACDMVIVGIGVTPDVDFLSGSGVLCEDGVLVNDRLQSNVPEVFAAGDVANFFDPVFQRQRRIEHWDNAIRQGRLAAKNMLDSNLPYDEVSTFYCEVFDKGFQFLGAAEGTTERIEMGSLESGSWATLFLNDHIPKALITMGRPAAETRAARGLIRYRTHIERSRKYSHQTSFSMLRVPSQTVLVLQGGGALGAFECGVVKALEQCHVQSDIIAGVSIGAFNGAIIASHPRGATQALEAFWSEIAMMTPCVANESARRWLASMHAMAWGVPALFRPRWMPVSGWQLPYAWTSYYDSSPARHLLEKYVDFKSLRRSPVRLLVSAVEVETADLRLFDSYVDDIGVDHILASGSLPPGLPWTTVAGRNYWDGGIVSNSPLEQVVGRCGVVGKRVVIVDLFTSKGDLPATMADVWTRRDEILYAERMRRTTSEDAVLGEFRKLVDECLSQLDKVSAEQIRQRPRYVDLMGEDTHFDIIRILREASPHETASRDFDFSTISLNLHRVNGYHAGLQAMKTYEASHSTTM
ncbi:MAG: FAD-dependent oxidoreductase [Pseudomonadota bacterium]